MNYSGRLALIKITLIAMIVYTAIYIKLPGWLLRAVEKLSKAFLWTSSDEVWGGKCLLAWGRVKCPLWLGGLGILDLRRFGRALQVRWLWLRRSTQLEHGSVYRLMKMKHLGHSSKHPPTGC
jgi:hypothetical protein